MLDKFDILVMSDALYDEILKGYSTHNTFTAPGDGFFLLDGLRFKRIKVGLDQMSLNRVKAKKGTYVACLDDDYAHLGVCFDVGVRTIWLNRRGKLVPDGMPVQDADVVSVGDLVKDDILLQKPSLKQCYAWWNEWDLPENIRRHVKTVAWGAYVLAVKLRNKGVEVDPILTHRGGLMHDIDKIETLDKDGQHGQMGAEFLLQQGYPAMAEIVREHIMDRILKPGAEDLPWEVKLVYFVDKLVEGDQMVEFDVRRKALIQRYPDYRDKITASAPAINELSDHICSILSLASHGRLVRMLKDQGNLLY